MIATNSSSTPAPALATAALSRLALRLLVSRASARSFSWLRATLRAAVSRLRRALEAGPGNGTRRPRVLTRPPGYVLEVNPRSIDAARFEALAAEGRRALAEGDFGEASSLLGEALGLWRGPALAEFTYEPFAQPAIARLEELMEATEDHIEAELACGPPRRSGGGA
jgi:DNA-binding SARP family transcriptional activator